jgi:hypothetical protein
VSDRILPEFRCPPRGPSFKYHSHLTQIIMAWTLTRFTDCTITVVFAALRLFATSDGFLGVIAIDDGHHKYTLIEACVTLEAPVDCSQGRVDSQTTAHTAQHSAFSIEPLLARVAPSYRMCAVVRCALWFVMHVSTTAYRPKRPSDASSRAAPLRPQSVAGRQFRSAAPRCGARHGLQG